MSLQVEREIWGGHRELMNGKKQHPDLNCSILWEGWDLWGLGRKKTEKDKGSKRPRG